MKKFFILLQMCLVFFIFQFGIAGKRKRKYVVTNAYKRHKDRDNVQSEKFLFINDLPKDIWCVIAQQLTSQEKSDFFYAFSLISKHALAIRFFFIKASSLLAKAIYYHQELDLIKNANCHLLLEKTKDGYLEKRYCSTNFKNKAIGRKIWFPTIEYLFYLIKQGVDVNCVLFEQSQITPLEYAIDNMHCLIMPLYERGALLKITQNPTLDKPFYEYIDSCRGLTSGKIKKMDGKILQLLFDPAVIDLYQELPAIDHQIYWHYLCEFADKETVRFFLNQLNYLEKDPFIYARSLCHQGYTALHFACRGGDVAVVRFLLASGFDKYLNKQDDPRYAVPLFVACRHLRVKVVQLLLDNNADITKVDNYGRTPLMLMQDWLYDMTIDESGFITDSTNSISETCFSDDRSEEDEIVFGTDCFFEVISNRDYLRRTQKIESIMRFLVSHSFFNSEITD